MHRCSWSTSSELYMDYHDTEWGVPEYNDHKLFEMICLEGAQAGLSWITVLKKRENYRIAFDQFDAEKMARYTDIKKTELMQNAGIIRNKLKIKAFVNNAKAYLSIKESGSTFSNYIWKYTEGLPKVNHHQCITQVPAKSALSDLMSKDLKQDGFGFVGSTMVYAFMQASGMINDHVTSCFRHHELTTT